MSGALKPTRDVLLGVARTLPAAPQILTGVCELLQDVNTDLDQIAVTIRMDAALAARVIRVSNSVVYGGHGKVASVDEAISRVGFAEVVRLVGTATAAGLVDHDLRCYHINVDLAREAALMHALASEALAEASGMNPSTAYVGGLLRGIGTLVLERYARDRLPAERTFDPTEFDTFRAWEIARFGLGAAEVATMALDDWRFPEDTVAAIQTHLEPPDDGAEAARFANVLNLAGAIATEQGVALSGEVLHWASTPEKLAAAGLDEDRYFHASAKACALFEQQRHALY